MPGPRVKGKRQLIGCSSVRKSITSRYILYSYRKLCYNTVGVVAKVSAVCAELNINIEDVSQSIMQDMFCMIMLVDLSKATAEAAAVRDRFTALGKEMGMQVTVTRQEVFDAMHTI